MIDAYKKVIEIITSGKDIDHSAMLNKLAMDYPEIFVEIYTEIQPKIVSEYDKTIINFLINEKPVEAIKLIRDNYDLSLSSAKDVVDNLIVQLFSDGITKLKRNSTPNLLTVGSYPVYDKILKSV
jgi:ribosomal protein L7/L12